MVACRFLSDTDVNWRDILASHQARTQERIQTHPVSLCIQATTERNVNGQETESPGPLNDEGSQRAGPDFVSRVAEAGIVQSQAQVKY